MNVINSFRGEHTHKHTNFMNKSNFKKSSVLQPLADMHLA